MYPKFGSIVWEFQAHSPTLTHLPTYSADITMTQMFVSTSLPYLKSKTSEIICVYLKKKFGRVYDLNILYTSPSLLSLLWLKNKYQAVANMKY